MCLCVRPAADGKKGLPFSDTLVFCGGFDDVSSVFLLFPPLSRFPSGPYFPRRKEMVETPLITWGVGEGRGLRGSCHFSATKDVSYSPL